MSIVHSKVSGLPNTDPGKVGGADWDQHHLHGPGDVFDCGFCKLVFGPSYGGLGGNPLLYGAILAVSHDDVAHQVTFQIDLAGLAIAGSAPTEFFMDFSKSSNAVVPESLKFSYWYDSNMVFEIVSPTWVPTEFSQDVTLTGRLTVCVGAPNSP